MNMLSLNLGSWYTITLTGIPLSMLQPSPFGQEQLHHQKPNLLLIRWFVPCRFAVTTRSRPLLFTLLLGQERICHLDEVLLDEVWVLPSGRGSLILQVLRDLERIGAIGVSKIALDIADTVLLLATTSHNGCWMSDARTAELS
jgi:hypothetical protein